MLDNWTTKQLFLRIHQSDLATTIWELGRIAIIDDSELEKNWDTMINARTEVLQKYWKWCGDK